MGKAAVDLTLEVHLDWCVIIYLARGGTCYCSISFQIFRVALYFINIFFFFSISNKSFLYKNRFSLSDLLK